MQNAPSEQVAPRSAHGIPRRLALAAVAVLLALGAGATMVWMLGALERLHHKQTNFLVQANGQCRAADDGERAEMMRAAEFRGEAGLSGMLRPAEGSVFPRDMAAPTFVWRSKPSTDRWLIRVAFGDGTDPLHVIADGEPVAPIVDQRAVTAANRAGVGATSTNEAHWEPTPRVWARIKRGSLDVAATVSVFALGTADAPPLVAAVRICTSTDPVGAPIFYRDVPLMPSKTEDGIIKPLADNAIPLIEWRLRDVSRQESRVLLKDMPTCANCHSFSSDGGVLGMDMDGPQGDKGAYALAPIERRTTIAKANVMTWNRFPDRPPAHHTFGLMSQVSPDGRYVVSTVNESLFVCNYMDYRFLQTFYPTRGILAVYDSVTGEIARLPGADDPAFVQCCPVWTPDGQEILFLRARAKAPYGAGERPDHANDPRETLIQYDIFRVPFNAGRGGTAAAVEGASRNGKSNSFPKVSPDGRWMVYVQADNGLLMRPDSRLFIVPAQGGIPREMTCNMASMNSWHSWSPNSRWLVFSSKALRPFTQMFLTHIDEHGQDSPAVLIPHATADNRAVNIPEFVNVDYDQFVEIDVPAADYRRLLEEGNALALTADYPAAEQRLRDSLALRNDFPHTHVNLAHVLTETDRSHEAIIHCRRALELDPRFAMAQNNWARALERQGDGGQALAHFRRAAVLGGYNPTIRMNTGRALVAAGQLSEAMDHFREAARLDPESSAAAAELANVMSRLGLESDSVAALQEAAERDPGLAGRHINLGHALHRQGRVEEAVGHFRQATALDPASWSAHHNLATGLRDTGHSREAVAHYRRALSLKPGLRQAQAGLAWLLATDGDREIRDTAEAVRLAAAACEAPGEPQARYFEVLSVALAHDGQRSAAVSAARKALALIEDPDSAVAAGIRERIERLEAGRPVR